MNREERRNLMKNGASKETVDKLQAYNKPCTLLETVKISRAVAEDVMESSLDEYRRTSAGTMIALMIQLEILRETIIKSGLVSAEEFQSLYEKSAAEFEEKEREMLRAMREDELQKLNDMETAVSSEIEESAVNLKPTVNSVEVEISKRNSHEHEEEN